MEKSRAYYEKMFFTYPNVVTIVQFCEMLGGIGDGTARKLLRSNKVHHYYIRTTYHIPKASIIEYVTSDHYSKYKKKLKVHI